jgi:hypothetical protein
LLLEGGAKRQCRPSDRGRDQGDDRLCRDGRHPFAGLLDAQTEQSAARPNMSAQDLI